MSTTASNSSRPLDSTQKKAINAYVKDALSTRHSFNSDAAWARSYARNFYHSVDNTVGFLPVYHSLLNALYDSVAENSATVKSQTSSAKSQVKKTPTPAKAQTHEHPLLPTPQTQSESFQVKMDKLFKYAWPLHAEYRSLERWAKLQAAYWQMKGNVGYTLADISTKLLQMADAK